MGVPQKRERVFFIGLRNDFDLPKLVLSFNEKPILFGEVDDENGNELTEHQKWLWNRKKITDNSLGDINERERNILSDFNGGIVHDNKVIGTITASGKYIKYKSAKHLSNNSIIKIGSFPLDYNFKNIKPIYLIGMSVPPIVTAQISHQIHKQWLKKIKYE